MPQRANYTFAYDIGCPKRQYHIRKALQAYAVGSQKSLYECWLTEGEYHQLQQKIQQILAKTDCMMAFRRPSEHHCRLYGKASRLQFCPFMIV